MQKLPKITRLPSGSWHCTLYIDGQRIYITEPSKTACKEKALLIKAQAITGSLITSTLTLREAIDKYLDARSNVLSPATLRGYRTIQRNRFSSVMDMRIDKVANWQKVVNAETRYCNPKTLKNAWGFIKSVLAENGITPHGVTLPQILQEEHAILQPDEIKPFIAAVRGAEYELVYLLALHGLRKSEIMGLDIRNSVSGSEIRVRGAVVPNEEHKFVWKAENKNTTSRRTVPILIGRVTEIIKASPDAAQHQLRCTSNAVYRQLMQICQDNGFDYMGLHGLRHSFASLCYALKISEAETMRLGGWSDPAVMRKIYTHLSARENHESEERLRAFFG